MSLAAAMQSKSKLIMMGAWRISIIVTSNQLDSLIFAFIEVLETDLGPWGI
jgi:hypothetical protein